jgi:hypothetical protein
MYTPEKVVPRPLPCMTTFLIVIASMSRSREEEDVLTLTKPIRPVLVPLGLLPPVVLVVLLRMSLPAPSRVKYLTLPVNRKMNRFSCGTIRGFSEVNGTRQLVEGECDRIAGSSARIRGQLDSVRLCILPSCRSYPAILYPESDPARSYTPSPQRVKSFFDGGKLSPTRIECRGACDVVCTRERLGMQPDCHPARNANPTIAPKRELNPKGAQPQ